ncbi:MAG TPA: hypothetical protein VHD56_07645 [Tepidisphaeraceae bacterium]|nr:hypothetical protein [Tepidisphaeraceae bacterium]
MRYSSITMLLILTIANASLAQPTTQPGPGPGSFGRRGGRFMSPEMRQTLIWGQQNMPNMARIAAQSGRGPRFQRSMNMMNVRMHDLEKITDPAIRQRVMDNIATEDKIAQYILELDTTPAGDAREAVQSKIRATMRDLVKGLLADREDRLKKLQARLADEQKQLESDRRELELLVQRRITPFMMLIPATNPSEDVPASPANAMDIPAPQPK